MKPGDLHICTEDRMLYIHPASGINGSHGWIRRGEPVIILEVHRDKTIALLPKEEKIVHNIVCLSRLGKGILFLHDMTHYTLA